jgi:phosphomannomutase
MKKTITPANSERLSSIIKAYDIRGLYPDEIDAPTCRSLGAAFAKYCASDRIVIGRDMRESGIELSAAFAEGVMSQGVDVVDIDLASTDLLYFASGVLNIPGAMFTASHNPAGYNGIKLCGSGAAPISQESGLQEIKAIASGEIRVAGRPGVLSRVDLMEEFVSHVLSFVDLKNLRPLKLVVDTANGMGGYVVPPVFKNLPFEIEFLYPELDGTFPNHPADPLQPENLVDLQRRVLEVGADLGLALRAEGPGPILHNLICSKSTREAILESGGDPIRTKVGHSYIKSVMAETGAAFGGEHSGHYYFRRNYRADSGLIAALMVLEQLCISGSALSDLLRPLDRYSSSGEINTKVVDVNRVIERVGKAYATYEQDFLDGLTVDCGDWWFNLRPSNTEPLLRLNLEAKDKDQVEAHIRELLPLFDG